MTLPDGTRQGLRTAAAALLPLVLWGVLWVSLQSGEFRNFYNPPSAIGFVHGIRAILPLGAAYVAVIIILYNLYRHRGGSLPFVGPLGLAAVYGLVGLVSATRSPNEVTALYWTVVYLSVPLVLWAIVWGKNGLDNVVRLINITWLIIILGVAALLAIDFLYLGTKAQVQEKMNAFFDGLTHRKDEVRHRCRTLLQARADALMFTPAVPLPSLQNVVPTLALV